MQFTSLHQISTRRSYRHKNDSTLAVSRGTRPSIVDLIVYCGGDAELLFFNLDARSMSAINEDLLANASISGDSVAAG